MDYAMRWMIRSIGTSCPIEVAAGEKSPATGLRSPLSLFEHGFDEHLLDLWILSFYTGGNFQNC